MSVIRRALGVAAAAVAVLAVPVPAHAEPASPLTFAIRDLGVSTAGKWTRMQLRPTGEARPVLHDVKLAIDTAGVAGFATAWVAQFREDGPATPSDDCTVVGTVTTCTLGTLTGSLGYSLPYLVVEAEDGAEVGTSGTFTVTLTAKDQPALVATPTVTVADDVDIAAGPVGFAVEGRPGERVAASVEVTNTGTRPVRGAMARVIAAQGLTLAGRYTNCRYRVSGDEALCRFDEHLAPGATYAMAESPIMLKADAKADDEHTYVHMWWTGDDADEMGVEGSFTPGTEGVLRLVRKPAAGVAGRTTDSNFRNNIAFGFVTPYVTGPGGAQPSAAPSASPSAAPVAGGGSGGGLPVTGADVGTVAGIGGALLALGIGAVVSTRRRRSTSTD